MHVSPIHSSFVELAKEHEEKAQNERDLIKELDEKWEKVDKECQEEQGTQDNNDLVVHAEDVVSDALDRASEGDFDPDQLAFYSNFTKTKENIAKLRDIFKVWTRRDLPHSNFELKGITRTLIDMGFQESPFGRSLGTLYASGHIAGKLWDQAFKIFGFDEADEAELKPAAKRPQEGAAEELRPAKRSKSSPSFSNEDMQSFHNLVSSPEFRQKYSAWQSRQAAEPETSSVRTALTFSPPPSPAKMSKA